MFRSRFLVFVALLALAGCRRPAEDPKVAEKVDDVIVAPKLVGSTPKTVAEFEAFSLFSAPTDAGSAQYDAALTQGLTLLADQDYAKALQAFETAKAAKDTDFVRGEIAKLKLRLESDVAAKKTTQDIQVLLDDGNPQAASKLINDALKVYGGGPDAVRLVQLQAQADALLAAGGNESPEVRAKRLRDAAQVALQDQSLRAAAGLLQQSLALADDAGVRDQLRDVQGQLDKYDGLRKRAAELRRNPTDMEDALALYQQAKATWNTPEVRQDIDDCAFALQKRRDTISVADFEVQGDVGVPAAGEVIAEELLPTFKPRFDLVEREQIGKVLKELNLGVGFQNNPDQQREVGKLARTRFLVLGSVNRNGAVTARARLVDAATGLVVQTAKISAPTFDQLLPRLPELTKQLLMTDDEKLAFDQAQMAAQAAAPKIDVVQANAPLPPPPQAVGGQIAGPWINNAPPPPLGGLQPQQFQALQPPPAAAPVVVVPPPVADFRAQLIVAAVQMGDGFFVRGQFREAFQQYEFALSLAPGDFAIRARLDQCRPFLPPVVIVAARPRLAILNFLVIGNLPPGLSVGTPNLLAPYFAVNYDIVDQGQVYWMMARLGLSQGDLMNNPSARVWLGRSLGVQYFLLGDVRRTASFDVNTYLLNAETGWLQGHGHIHVHNPFELKLRAGELAQLTQMLPAQRAQYVAAQPQVEVLLSSGRNNLNQGNLTVAIGLFQNILGQQPGNIQATLFLNQAREAQRHREIEELRRKEIAQREALILAEQRRQRELAAAAERERILAAQLAASRAQADRLALAKQRANAYADMVARAREARKVRNFALATNLYQGALDMTPPAGAELPVPHDVLVGELAAAKAEIARANDDKARAEQAAAHEAELRKKRETELALARQKLDDERRKSEAAAASQQKLNDAKYQAAFDQGQTLMAQGKFDAAIVALQGARQLKKTDAVEAMLHTALSRQAEAHAKGDAERQAIETKIAAERKRQKEIEEESKRNHDQYDQSLKAAKDAFAQKKYDAAQSHYESANKLFSTDDVKSGLKKVQAARAAESAAEKQKADKTDRVAKLVSAGNDALTAGNYADSIQKLEQARQLDPTNVDVLAALSRAQQAQTRAAIASQPKTPVVVAPPTNPVDDAKKQAAALKLIQDRQAAAYEVMVAQKALQAKDWNGAIKGFQTALKIDPSNTQAAQGLQQAQTGLTNAQSAASQAERDRLAKLAQEEEARKAKAAQDALAAKAAQEAAALKLKQEEEARKKLAADQSAKEKLRLAQEEAARKQMQEDEARKKLAADQAAKDRLRLAQEEEARKAAAAKEAAMQGEQKKKQSYADAIQHGQRLANEKKYAEAMQALQGAKSLYPNDPQVTQLMAQTSQQWENAKRANADDEAAKRKAAEARNQYQNEMNKGQQALNQKQYPQAIQHFEAALRFMPGDANATRLLQQARAGKK